MVVRSRRVRSLVMGSYISSTIASFVVFILMIVMFGFDLEDQIFDYQVSRTIENVMQGEQLPKEASGSVQSLEMQYYIGLDSMPAWLRGEVDPEWQNRSFEVFAEERGHFHAAVRTLENGRNIYLLFDARPFIRSTPQIKAYLAIIGTMAGLVFLVSLFFMLRTTRKVSVPLEDMAAVLSDGKQVTPSFDLPAAAPAELHALARAIEERDVRISALLDREREFNRDASHELRTPLAVAYGAVEVLEETDSKSKALFRLKTAIKDMQLLTEGILWLGRDPARSQACNAIAVCQQCITAYSHLVGDRKVLIRLDTDGDVEMQAPEAVALVMVGNILRNALSYTDQGEVVLFVRDGFVRVTDTGAGYGHVNKDREGFGVGLTLVTRLCHHFGLSFSVNARKGGGSEARLGWNTGKHLS